MANPPQGWKQGNQPNIYEANIKQVNISTGTVSLVGETNKSNGSYTVYSTSGINFIGSRTPLYTVSSSGARTIQNASVYNQLQQSGEIIKLDNSIKPKAFEINKTFGTEQEKQTVSSSTLYKSLANAATPPTPTPEITSPEKISDPGIKAEGIRLKYENYYYPETLINNKNKQDIIRFTAYSYGSRPVEINGATKDAFGSPGLGSRNLTLINGSVTLPIQPSITDTNSVTWGNEELNPLQAYGAASSYAAQEDIAAVADALGTQADKLFKQSNFKNAARIYLAGKAVGVNGLLSRVGGAILNPNMELLFQGPQLRPFNFTFRLSPRSDTEATQVKNIIRFFKQNMSVKNSESNLFLKAPNVFQIRYLINGENKNHQSLNRIKICALQSCSVDYTPDGSYMTFNDDTRTMTSYELTLQFMELEPITEKDYSDKSEPGQNQYQAVSLNEIGY